MNDKRIYTVMSNAVPTQYKGFEPSKVTDPLLHIHLSLPSGVRQRN